MVSGCTGVAIDEIAGEDAVDQHGTALKVAMTMAGMTSTLRPVAAVCAPRQAAFGIGRDGGSVLR